MLPECSIYMLSNNLVPSVSLLPAPLERERRDPRPGVKVPCFGDQLTRVRLAGAKDLRAGSHTAQDRLDHLYPFRIVDRSFLKVKKCFDHFSQGIHVDQPGSLFILGVQS